jgi:hypothetical protein
MGNPWCRLVAGIALQIGEAFVNLALRAGNEIKEQSVRDERMALGSNGRWDCNTGTGCPDGVLPWTALRP